jgi:hypothetical protein
MEFVTLTISSTDHYCYKDASNITMNILGDFLSNVGCHRSSFKDFALNEWEDVTGGNVTSLRKKNGYIYFSDSYSEEKKTTELKMSIEQYIQLLDDWQEKVCKHKPKEVTITYDDNQFTIETSDV